MKFIHCADLHLGSRLSSLPTKDREKRRNEIVAAYNRMVQYAKNNGINTILLSGDVFDSDSPAKKDKEFFYNAIKGNPDIRFLYLRGNHDTKESLEEHYDNLLMFSEEWTSYEFNDVVVSGIEITPSNSDSLYASLSLDKNKVNIVMMHGDINNEIDLKKLANKNIDYLALGHIHSYEVKEIDKRGKAVYSGCLEGRGFDELGPKGFVVVDVTDNKVTHEFIATSQRVGYEVNIDITNQPNFYNAIEYIQHELDKLSKESFIKVIVTGRVSFDVSTLESDIEGHIVGFYNLKVESKVKKIINPEDYKNNFSLIGEYVRKVLADNTLSDEDKEEILNLGIKLINGEEIE